MQKIKKKLDELYPFLITRVALLRNRESEEIHSAGSERSWWMLTSYPDSNLAIKVLVSLVDLT